MRKLSKDNYNFCAGNKSDPKDIYKTIIALKRMIRYGKHAEHVLNSLQENGYYNDRCPILEEGLSDFISYKATNFPIKAHISKEDINYKNLQIKIDVPQKVKYNRSKLGYYLKSEITLYGCNKIIFDEKYIKKNKWPNDINSTHITRKELNEKIGNLNMFGSCVSFNGTPGSFYNRIYRRIKINTIRSSSEKSKEDRILFANLLTGTIINTSQRHFIYNYNDDSIPQYLIDLINNLPNWLIEDNIVQNLFNQMLDFSKVLEVMDS